MTARHTKRINPEGFSRRIEGAGGQPRPALTDRSARAALPQPRTTPCRAEPSSRRQLATSTGAKMRCVALPRLGSPTSACASDGAAEAKVRFDRHARVRGDRAGRHGSRRHRSRSHRACVATKPSRARPAPPHAPPGVALTLACAHTATSRVRRSAVRNGRFTSHALARPPRRSRDATSHRDTFL